MVPAREILDWSEKQPLWRRDLMRRLAILPTLDAAKPIMIVVGIVLGVTTILGMMANTNRG